MATNLKAEKRERARVEVTGDHTFVISFAGKGIAGTATLTLKEARTFWHNMGKALDEADEAIKAAKTKGKAKK